MKWESKSDLMVYAYSIDVDAFLAPVYHLVLELANATYAGHPFNELAEEVFDVEVITGKDSLDEETSPESFLIEIARHLSGNLYANLDKLDGSNILLLYEPKKLLIAPAKCKPNQTLIGWIKKAGMMREFLDLVKYEQINNSKETLVQLLNDQYFGSAVKVKAVNTLKATIIPINALENYDVQPVDTESIWISNHLSKRLSLNEGTEYGELKFSDIDEISLKVGDFRVT